MITNQDCFTNWQNFLFRGVITTVMNIQNISFGRKIPLTECKVKNLETKKFVPVTFYEVDCQDYKEIEDIRDSKGKWNFMGPILYNMDSKHMWLQKNSGENPYKFYILENKAGEILGISQTENKDNNITVKFLDSGRNKEYKYVGQTMLASMGQQVVNNGGTSLNIMNPTIDAYPFYTKNCKFEETENSELTMNPNQIKKFIRRTQFRTHSRILDSKA